MGATLRRLRSQIVPLTEYTEAGRMQAKSGISCASHGTPVLTVEHRAKRRLTEIAQDARNASDDLGDGCRFHSLATSCAPLRSRINSTQLTKSPATPPLPCQGQHTKLTSDERPNRHLVKDHPDCSDSRQTIKAAQHMLQLRSVKAPTFGDEFQSSHHGVRTIPT